MSQESSLRSFSTYQPAFSVAQLPSSDSRSALIIAAQLDAIVALIAASASEVVA